MVTSCDFEVNQTKIKGGCQSGRKVVPHYSKSDSPLDAFIFPPGLTKGIQVIPEFSFILKAVRMKHKVMTSETHLHPWKNGYWYNSSQKCLLTKIGDDGIFETHTTNYLDYPNMVPKFG